MVSCPLECPAAISWFVGAWFCHVAIALSRIGFHALELISTLYILKRERNRERRNEYIFVKEN